MKDGEPELTIVIGANGAGKTTWARVQRDALPKPFYNADSIAEGLGGWDDSELQRLARALVDERIEAHVRERSTFGFESTYSGRSRPNVVRTAKARRVHDEGLVHRHRERGDQHRPGKAAGERRRARRGGE